MGVTTNPMLLKMEKVTAFDFYDNLSSIDEIILSFFQITKREEVEKFYEIPAINRPKIVFKIPLVKEHYNFLKSIKNFKYFKYYTCGTITYDLVQLYTALDLGVDYCIILVSKNENKNFLEEAVEFKNKHKYKTDLIAASFREKNDIIRALSSGVEYLTIPPNVMEKIFINAQAEKDYENFSNYIS